MTAAMLLARLVLRIAPPRHAAWASAMAMEIVAIDAPAALPFATGCLRAAVALRIDEGRRTMLATMNHRPRAATMACGAIATALGLVYLAVAGAPAAMLVANAGALVLALVVALAIARVPPSPAIVVPLCGAALLVTAVAGIEADGAARWVRVAGVAMQPSLILLPLAIVLHVAAPGRATGGGMALAAAAMALQPDRAMAGTLLLALLASGRRGGILPILAAALAFAVTMLRPDALPASAFVDGILFSAPRDGLVAGLAVWGGIVVALVPLALAARSRDRSVVAFALCWTGVVAAAAFGNYPTPLVGYGGSAILGYLLAAAALPARVAVSDGVRQAAAEAEWDRHELPRLA